MKAKVWMLIWGLKDGGAETLAREYARLIDKQTFEASIVTVYPFTNTANYQRTQELGLRTISVFKKRNAFTRALRVLFGKWYIPYWLLKTVQQEKPDCIHLNSEMATWYLPIAERVHNVRLVYTCHSEVSKHFSDAEERAVKALRDKCGIQLIALHEVMREEMNERFAVSDTIVIKNGVDFVRFKHPQKKRHEIRKELKIAKNAVVVGHVGRFSQVKNHAFLLKVFMEISNREDHAHLLMVGNGELETEIRKQIEELQLSERVTILSHRNDIPELLSAMDVMVFPSFYEGVSVALVEAQASGLRCIVSDSVKPENFLLDTTIPMSLNADVSAWADAALNTELRNADHGNIEDYDMNREIRRLEKVYCGYDPE